MKPKKIRLYATIKNRSGIDLPYEIKVVAWATMGDLLIHVRRALLDQHGIDGEYEVSGVRIA